MSNHSFRIYENCLGWVEERRFALFKAAERQEKCPKSNQRGFSKTGVFIARFTQPMSRLNYLYKFDKIFSKNLKLFYVSKKNISSLFGNFKKKKLKNFLSLSKVDRVFTWPLFMVAVLARLGGVIAPGSRGEDRQNQKLWSKNVPALEKKRTILVFKIISWTDINL